MTTAAEADKVATELVEATKGQDIQVLPAQHDNRPRQTTLPPVADPRDMRASTVPQVSETRWSAEVGSLVGALAKAQVAFTSIEKNKTAMIKGREGKASYSYKYADLSEVMESIRKPLGDNGLVVVQFPATVDRGVAIETVCFHESGQFIRNRVHIPGVSGSPQDLGILLAYARRYGVSALFALAAGEQDTDGRTGRDVDTEEAEPVTIMAVRDVEGAEGTAWVVRTKDGVDYVADDAEVAEAAKKNCDNGGVVVLDWETRQTRSKKPYRHLLGIVAAKRKQ